MQEAGGNQDVVLPEQIWQAGISDLETELDPQVFAAYIKPLRLTAYNENAAEVIVTAPSRLVCRHVDENFRDKLSERLSQRLGVSGLTVKLSVETGAATGESEKRPRVPYVVVKRTVNEGGEKSGGRRADIGALDPKYTFSTFVVGSNSQFCHAAARRVAEEPGKSYNPLFIYGGVGLGKTHLLHAIGNMVLEKNPYGRVLYMSSETFTNELIQSLRMAKMDAFKNRLRNIEVLLIDDIQFMCGKERTQEEFFHTFNALYSARNQIIMTSDKLPQEIPGIEERLRTRFSWGLTADLQAPDFETRVAILKRKAALDGCSLPENVAHLIAERVSSNVRELEGALTRLHAVSSLQDVSITVELARSALREILEPKPLNITVDDIKKTVATHFNIKISDMVSKRRTRNLSFPRHIAMFLCRKHTTASYPEIGGHFGGRDHSSVIHAANVVSGKVKNDPEVKELVEQVEQQLLGNR